MKRPAMGAKTFCRSSSTDLCSRFEPSSGNRIRGDLRAPEGDAARSSKRFLTAAGGC